MTPSPPNDELPHDAPLVLRATVAAFAGVLVVAACAAFVEPIVTAGASAIGLTAVGAWSLSRARRIELSLRLDEVHRETDAEEKRRLHEVRDEMEREICELREAARGLELARQEAETANMAKGAFLAHMSHELRTPLNGILGMGRLLLETDLAREQRDFTAAILESSESLLVLANDVLDLSKIEAGKLELAEEEFDLHACLEKAVGLLVPKAAEKGLELICSLEPDVPRQVRGDGSRLRQVVVSLLGNAIKFTDAGEVELEVGSRGLGDGRFELKVGVRDTGPGIAADRVGEIFEPFTHGSSTAVRRFGTGLGLTIGRQLAETMGGDMGVESEEGRGSLFWFTAVLRDVGEAEEPEDGWSALSGLTVLLVDDNAAQRRRIRSYLERWDVACVDVASRREALDALARRGATGRSFDVAFIDSDLEGCDGIELAQTILQDPEFEPPHLVLLKDFRCQYKAGRLTRIGFDAWISKPIWPNVLREAFHHLRDVAEQIEVRDALRRAPEDEWEKPAETATFDLDVLLAEDNVVNQKVATLLLQKLGCSVDVVSNGRKAVEAARTKRYDLVFMDCQMPVMNGYDATRGIRAFEHGQLPIVAMTASAMAEDRQRCLDSGMDDHLSKPVNLDQLRSILERWGHRSSILLSSQNDPMNDPHSNDVLDRETLAALRELSDGDNDLFAELVDLFLEDTPPRLEELQTALDADDAKALEAAAHGLKSSCANIGALALSELCRQIELLGREERTMQALDLVERSTREFERVREALQEELAG